ncbi:A/G-specific adenine glycosylase [Buchnera aphidicola]|uniref:A/G-specific adenine glycosylase n=1 Tax=Buchnera aphidicola TaxID=9 RepID=UPI0030EE2FB1
MKNSFIFSQCVINWYHFNGRKNLPWQINTNIYKVWISEIMLQQTQVKTVIPFFKNFIKKFPTLISLCKKNNLNKILFLWSGLGYYKRAENIYKTTELIKKKFNNKFPNNYKEIIKFPGIGKSTAGAILSLSLNYFYPILDGNIKRILQRFYYIKNIKNINSILWKKIYKLIPLHNSKKFNQAMMDIGYKICTINKPKCKICPINERCISYYKNNFLIKKKKKKNKIKKNLWFVFIYKKNFILLKKNKKNLWKNLFFPLVFYSKKKFKNFIKKKKIKKKYINKKKNKTIYHIVTKYKFYIHYFFIKINKKKTKKYINKKYIWFNTKKFKKVGLSKPIIKILKKNF